MTLTCYVIDDDGHAVDATVKNIEKTPGLRCIGYNTDPIIALEEIKAQKPQIVFLDIEMPELSGLEVAGLLPEDAYIVFITSHSKYAIEAIEKDAVGYLLKPFSYHMFIMCIEKVKARVQKADKHNDNKGQDTIFINSGTKGKITQVVITEILYLGALKNVICIYTNQENYTSRISIKNICSKLPASIFVRIHRSYVVNIEHIRSVEGNTITMLNGVALPFGELYKNDFMDKIQSRLIKG
ncbi:LytR/AlgR family response regulator transcription factor [Pedobacter sp. UC225_65]|uniref:LytR/AlgR family response regulator transcription factor n=1 Tax=Pedobacter sp. UC225_65 TaxID=3350173 RepID=UPI0036716F35